jgi:hypothetical protein
VIEDVKLNRIVILQPHLVDNLLTKFGEEVANNRVNQTPWTPRLKIVCLENVANLIESNLQSRYRCGVGMFISLTKYSRPDSCNVVREFSKCMDKATMSTYLEMLMVMKLVINTKHFCLRNQPETKFKKIGVSIYFAIAIGREI